MYCQGPLQSLKYLDPNKPPDLSIAGCYLFFKSQFTYHLYRKFFPDHPIKNLPLYGNNFCITYTFITFFSSLDSRSPLFAIYICANIYPKSRKGPLEKVFATPWTIVYGILQARIVEYSPVYFPAFPFSRASSQPRDQTQASHIVGRFFTSRATREAREYWSG